MKKSDLKTGMIIVDDDNSIGLVINKSIVYFNGAGWNEWSEISEDLVTDEVHLIIKVYQGDNQDLSQLLNNCDVDTLNLNYDLLWERNPIETIEIAGKKFDKNEVENALKDLKPIE